MDIKALLKIITEEKQFCKSRCNNLKTSVKQYAKFLGFDDPSLCKPIAYNLPRETRRKLIERNLRDKASYNKIRNLKNNISFLIRNGCELGLIPNPDISREDQKAVLRKNKKSWFLKRKRKNAYWHELSAYALKYKDWNVTLKKQYQEYVLWITKPVNISRPARIKKRYSTVETELEHFESLAGYLVNINNVGVNDLTLKTLFDYRNIENFAYWFANERHNKVTRTLKNIISCAHTISKYYLKDPKLTNRIHNLQLTLSKPLQTYDKQDEWVTLSELESVGLAEYELAKQILVNPSSKRPGLNQALIMQRSLIIRLLVRVPLRQRNIRELKFSKNLYLSGLEWKLIFRGEDLKISIKKGKENVFQVDFPIELERHLEEFICDYRPALCNGKENEIDYLFINSKGKPYNYKTLNEEFKKSVYAHIGKAPNIHLVRDIWATECLYKTKNPTLVAQMLNDNIETIYKHYYQAMSWGLDNEMREFLGKALKQ